MSENTDRHKRIQSMSLYDAIRTIAKYPTPVIPLSESRTQVVPAIIYTSRYEEAVNFLIDRYNCGALVMMGHFGKPRLRKSEDYVMPACEYFADETIQKRGRRKKERYYKKELGKEWKYGENSSGSKQVQRGRERASRSIFQNAQQKQEPSDTRTCDGGDETGLEG